MTTTLAGGRRTRRRTLVASLAAATMLLTTAGIAVADNVQNDVTAGGNDTITLGNSTTINYRIQATNGDGENGCNATPSSPAIVTVNTPGAVTATPSSRTFTSCGTFQGVNFSAAAVGNYVITVNVSDSGPGTYNTNPATFTLKVLPPPDSTPPVITPNVTGTLGDDGWYTSDVNVSWSVSDPESAVSSTSGCGSTTIASDTTGQTLTCSATSGGGTNSQSVTIKRDATAPDVTPGDVPAGAWRNTALSQGYTATDATPGSGLASSGDASFTLVASAESANASTPTTVSRTVKDRAGNATTRTLAALIDLTPPSVAVTGVTHGSQYTLGSVPTAGCSTSDALSGVATHATPNTSAGTVGSITATCSGASDNAGNTASAAVTYTVVYDFAGFYQPVDNDKVNVAKAGSAIPVKFSLKGNQGMGVLASGFPKSVSMTCNSTAPVDAIEETVAAGNSSLQYDATTDVYTFVWKSDKSWNGCRQLQIRLADGMTYTANFRFNR